MDARVWPDEADGDAVPELPEVVAGLRAVRERWREAHQRTHDLGVRDLPSSAVLGAVVERLRGALFPMRLGPPELRPGSEDFYVGHTLDTALGDLLKQVRLELHYRARHGGISGDLEAEARRIVRALAADLPAIRELLDSDVMAAWRGDPAAHSVDEVLLCYPGLRALVNHRLAHRLYLLGVPMLARVVAELAHSETGIDIHPGARIGAGFFIDHGTGVVIGETTIIGSHVRIYQAVTLGAKRFETDSEGMLQKGAPRHPVVEDDVVIYAGATILGRVTVGRGSTIGGNVWLTRSVPPGSQVSQALNREGAQA